MAKGLSQERLALEASLDRSYVGRVERGLENVTVSTLEALANAMGVHVSALFDEVDPKASKPEPLRSGRKPKPA
ncbi:transcriptional regulator with XRE-family HTH domain [Rhizobium sp. BK060]|nr:transcriptional regulator with XRE-family HTH domain [Rhizobium sp. BK060]